MQRKKFILDVNLANETKIRRKYLPRKLSDGSSTFTQKELNDVTLLAKLGATNVQIATYFQVDVTQIEKWLRASPEFAEARKRGGMEADMKVAQGLYKRAVGYSYIEEEYSAVTNPITGKKLPIEEMVLVKKVKKMVPPEVKAAIHWLRNRQRALWSAGPEMIHNHKGKVGHFHMALQAIPVEELSQEAQAMLFEITQKQIELERTAEDNSQDGK